MIYLFGVRPSFNVNNDQTIENSIIQEYVNIVEYDIGLCLFLFRYYLTSKQKQIIDRLRRPPNRNERAQIGNYIRLFETLVILGLKKYVSSDKAEFQASVLDLLVRLLLLRVNYSLLDSDEVRVLNSRSRHCRRSYLCLELSNSYYQSIGND
jgi:hypothetical protein